MALLYNFPTQSKEIPTITTSDFAYTGTYQLTQDTEGWQIESSIIEALKDRKFHYVDKPTFGSKELSFMIALTPDKNLDIDVVGFCTDICVVSNVLMLKAAVYNRANITVDSSCCAGTSKEMHNEALNVMKSCQINII